MSLRSEWVGAVATVSNKGVSMRKTILMILLAVVSIGAMAEWVKVSESDAAFFYIDLATIRRNGDFRRVWEMRDMKKIDKDGVMSVRALMEYDCNEERSRILSISEHSEPTLGGKVLLSSDDPSTWRYVAPGTVFESTLKVVCTK